MAYIENIIDKKLIRGTSSRDSIVNGKYWNNSGTASTILSGDGNDIIENWGFDVSINGGKGNDYIYNNAFIVGASVEYASNVSIEGGKGNDTLHNVGAGIVYIYNNGDGNDLIRAFNESDTLLIASGTWSTKKSGSDVVVTVGKGKITLEGAKTLSQVNIVSSKKDIHPVTFINNYKADTLITGTSYKDSIYNDKASSVTINAGADNDTIENSGGSDVSIDGGAGNDRIFNNIKNVTISGGKGNDYILNYNGNTGDIGGLGANVSINGGAGNDSIINYGRYVTIMRGSGNDTIENGGNNVTIAGGKGNDLISLDSFYNGYSGVKNNVILYSAGDGNDSILNFNADSTLSISGGSYSTQASGLDVIVTVGDGKISLMGAARLSAVHINKDMLLTDKTKSTVKVGSSIKTVDASARTKAIKITGNAKANSIVGGTKNDSLYGGNGNDTIRGNAGNDKLYGQAGNDKLYGGAGKDSLIGGKGNDSLWGNSGADTFIYGTGDGKDVIYGFENDDLLQITGTFSASYSKSKSEVYFKVGSTSKAVTLKNFTATSFNVNGDTYQISGSKFKKQ